MKDYYDLKGFELEKLLLGWLKLTGYEVVKSSKEDDIRYDIDAWVRGYQFNEWVSISIKAQSAGCSTGHLSFEDTNEHCPNDAGWYRTGRADYYFILREPSGIPDWQKERYPVPANYQPRYYTVSKLRVQQFIQYKAFYLYKGLHSNTLERQNGKNSYSFYVKSKHLLAMSDRVLLPYEWCDIVRESRRGIE